MTFKEWLDKQCEKRAPKLVGDGIVTQVKFDELKLNNGVSLSVQASECHYCEPRETLKTNEYESVEVYAHGEKVDRLCLHTFDGTVYRYIPVEEMELICKENGGIANG